MTVIYKERIFLDRYRCIDTVKKINVIKKAFIQGGLTYFKIDNFNYFIIDSDLIINVIEV